jgi:hypothetical protein
MKLTAQQIDKLRFLIATDLKQHGIITSDTVHHALNRANELL